MNAGDLTCMVEFKRLTVGERLKKTADRDFHHTNMLFCHNRRLLKCAIS